MSLPLKICVICGQKSKEFLPRSGQRITFYHKDHSSVRYEAMLYRGIELCFRTSKALLCKRQSIELRPQKHCSKGCEAMFMKRQNKAPWAMKQCCLIERTVLLNRNSRGLLSTDYFFDVVEFVQGFDRRQVVNVEAQDFVAYLHEHGVVELEE